MKGAVLYGPRDVRDVERDDPTILEPTDVILRLSVTCVCGSDLCSDVSLRPAHPCVAPITSGAIGTQGLAPVCGAQPMHGTDPAVSECSRPFLFLAVRELP